MTQINPYRRNCEILQKFFAKPLTLIIALAFCFSYISESIYTLICYNSVAFNAITLFSILGFSRLYFTSKKINGKTPKSSIGILETYSIINIIFSGLLLLCVILAGVLSTLYPSSTIFQFLNSIDIYIVACIVPSAIINLFLYIAMLKMLGAFRKSTSSVFLSKKGSVFFGVMSLIALVYNGAMIFFELPLNGLLSQAEQKYFVDTYIPDSSLLFIITVVSGVISCILYLLLAMYAFSYNSYIKSHCNKINIEKPNARYTQLINEKVNKTPFESNNPTVNMRKSIYQTPQNYNQQQIQTKPNNTNFTPPQPVQFNPTPVFNPQQHNMNQDNNAGRPIPPYQNNPYIK